MHPLLKKILDPPLVSLVLSTIVPLVQLIPYMKISIVRRRRLQLDSTSGQVTGPPELDCCKLLFLCLTGMPAPSQLLITHFSLYACLCVFLVCAFFSSSRISYVYFLVPSFIC